MNRKFLDKCISKALGVEALESRKLMSVSAGSGAGPDAATVARLENQGFVPVKWNGHRTYAAAGEWILQLDNVGAGSSATTQLASINEALRSVRPDAKAVEVLGSDGRVLVETPQGAKNSAIMAAVRRLKGVKIFEPNFAVYMQATPNDTYYAAHLWNMNNTGQGGGTVDADIDAAEAWDLTKGSPGVVVGVLDSGIDYTHPDLAANMWKNPGEVAGDLRDNDGNGYIDDVYGYDFRYNDANPMDDNGHGTHVAGTIAAVGNNARGVAGVSWNSKVMALKFLGADGSGDTAGAIKALDYARTMRTKYGVNVKLTNNSWGGGDFSLALQDAIARQRDAGILFVAAAGNGDAYGIGINNDVYPSYPSGTNLPNVVAVAATNRNDVLATFSNYGATSVDLAAPGVDIASTYPNNQYVYMSGTSMATPNVSGVAALAWSVAPAATYQQVKDALLNGVDKVAGLAGKVLTGGRLNARRTLELLTYPTAASAGGPYSLNEGQGVTLTRTASSDPNGDVVRYTWDVNGDGAFGDETAGTVNGLSLTFTAPQLAALGIADGNATYDVTVRSDDGNSHVTTSQPAKLTLRDVAPTMTVSGADSVTQDAAYTLTVGAVSDPGRDTVAQYVVHWGDGTSQAYTAAEVAAAARALSHTYAQSVAAGLKSISVDLVDEDGTHAGVARKDVTLTAVVKAAPQNLALGKTATQSSTGWGGVAARAVDGNTDGAYWNGSVSTTYDDVNAWWQVDLESAQSIGTVELFNRTDYDPQRLSNFYVMVSDAPFASTGLAATLAQPGVSSYYFDGPAGVQTNVAINRTGRYVRVQLAGTNYLSLAEVRVMSGDDAVTPSASSPATAASSPAAGTSGTAPVAMRPVFSTRRVRNDPLS